MVQSPSGDEATDAVWRQAAREGLRAPEEILHVYGNPTGVYAELLPVCPTTVHVHLGSWYV
jgi:hypothetical protein